MNIFEHTRASWVRYSDYEWREGPDGRFYLLPTPDAVPSIYDPTKVTSELVLAAVEIGRSLMGGTPPEKGRAAIREFAVKYGLLGIMTALPTTVQWSPITNSSRTFIVTASFSMIPSKGWT